MTRKDYIAERTLTVYAVPRVRSRDVKPVQDPAVCARAANAYGKAVKEESADRKVHILQVGDRYVVMDPEYRPDNYRRAVTFDPSFRKPLAVVLE